MENRVISVFVIVALIVVDSFMLPKPIFSAATKTALLLASLALLAERLATAEMLPVLRTIAWTLVVVSVILFLSDRRKKTA